MWELLAWKRENYRLIFLILAARQSKFLSADRTIKPIGGLLFTLSIDILLGEPTVAGSILNLGTAYLATKVYWKQEDNHEGDFDHFCDLI